MKSWTLASGAYSFLSLASVIRGTRIDRRQAPAPQAPVNLPPPGTAGIGATVVGAANAGAAQTVSPIRFLQ